MPRDHARMQTARWGDPDWCSLTESAQAMYDKICSQPRLSYCGVIDYFPSRLATLTRGQTEAKVRAAIKSLEKTRFVVLDPATHELLVRTYVRHDGVLERRNMGKAVARALGNVVSPKIRDAVMVELSRLKAEQPDLMGWLGIKELAPEIYEMTLAMASTMPFPMPSDGE